MTLRRRWTHLHSLAITGLVLVPEHNFLLSMGNDGACRVLDYLQVLNAHVSLPRYNNDADLPFPPASLGSLGVAIVQGPHLARCTGLTVVV